MNRYFFDEGLRFECTKCGHCCTGEPGVIYVEPEEITAIAGFLQMAEEDLMEYLFPYKDSYSIVEFSDGNCYFYENGCRIYPVRPKQCRTYPFWFSNLRSEAAWEKVAAECPGVGRGKFYNREEILDIVNM